MVRRINDVFESIRPPHIRQVFFRSLRLNRKLVLWYANKMVNRNSTIGPLEILQRIDQLRKQKNSFTFICNHLSYADSHMIEVLLLRFGFESLANHLIHIAGQKTYDVSRRMLTRSLNTVRVYQPKAAIDKSVKKKMNSRALKWASHLKRRGYSLLVFPEGTRTRRHTRFNIFAVNPKTTIYFRNSYVVPVALMGSENLMPVGKILPRAATIRIRIGDPVENAAIEFELRQEHPGLSETEFRKVQMLWYMQRINELLEPSYRYQ